MHASKISFDCLLESYVQHIHITKTEQSNNNEFPA